MLLSNLLLNIELLAKIGESDPQIKSITFDSREVTEGSLFVAVKGNLGDGHQYIGSAIERGAPVIVCEEIPADEVVKGFKGVIILTRESRRALAQISATFYNHPSKSLKVVGVTGTNGKTTIATLLFQLFTKLGYNCGLISTIENFVGNKRYDTKHTTPDPITINRLMSQMVESGCEFCFMEVSSHAIDQERVCAINFCGAIFTNITHDHLDYHKDFKSYIQVKKRLFDSLPASSFAVTNIDDKNGEVMVQNCNANKYTYSCNNFANFNCKILESTLEGMLLKIDNNEVWTKFIGLHNAHNLIAIYATAILLGANKGEVLTQISALESVAGRLEYLKGGDNITAVVDYAHTPDALANVLNTLREVAPDNEIITLFGCGGNRDKTKRPQMARIAAKYSDRVVVTSDNPRFEEPSEIIEDIKKGFEQKELLKTLFIVDRREAIRGALSIATKGAIVLVAGKGHENYQEIKGERFHFDDKEEITKTFELMK